MFSFDAVIVVFMKLSSSPYIQYTPNSSAMGKHSFLRFLILHNDDNISINAVCLSIMLYKIFRL